MKFMNMAKFYMAEAPAEGGSPVEATPAVEPVKEPAPSPTVEPKVEKEVKPVPSLNYSDTATKQVGTMMADAGIDPAKARDAVAANGGNCTPEIYAALSAKHGEGMASLLSGQMSKLHEASVEKNTAADTSVFNQVQEAFKGVTEQTGEKTFGELAGWAKENIPNDQRKELNEAISQGGFVAKLAVQELVSAFQQSGDYSQEMVGVEGDNVPNAPKGGDLTRQEYNEQLDALISKGHQYGQSMEMKALDARRTRSAKRGI